MKPSKLGAASIAALKDKPREIDLAAAGLLAARNDVPGRHARSRR
jgi:hypothetical protein